MGLPRWIPAPGARLPVPGPRRQNRRLVNRPRAGLRHHHAASWRRGGGRSLGVAGVRGSRLWTQLQWRQQRPPLEAFLRAVQEQQRRWVQLVRRRAATGSSGAVGGGRGQPQGAATGALAGGLTAAAGFSAARVASTGARTGGFTTTVPGGGATTTTGRVTAAPAGALATTGPAGGGRQWPGAQRAGTICGASAAAERSCAVPDGPGRWRSRRDRLAPLGRGTEREPWRAAGAAAGLRRHVRVARLFLVFLLLGQNGLQHVAGLGDMREVDLWRYGLRSARRRGAAMAGSARCRAQNAREPSPPHPPPGSWSGSCLRPGRVPPKRQESACS